MPDKKTRLPKKLLAIALCALLTLTLLPTTALAADAAAPKVKITWNANGGKIGTKTTKTVSYTKGKKIGKLQDAKRTGYTLKGWYTEKAGGTKIKTSTKAKTKATYYANWTAKKYTLTFNANGGSVGTKSKKVTYNKGYGALPKPTRGGYTFNGWYTAKSGGAKVSTTTKMAAKNVTVYAHWGTGVMPTSISLTLKSGKTYMPVTGGTCTLGVTFSPSNASANTAITWSSNKTSVATVDQSGKVTAKGAGEATITAATANGKTAEMVITVAPDVQSIEYPLDGSMGQWLYTDWSNFFAVTYAMVGETIVLPVPKIKPANAYCVLNYSTSNKDYVDIFQDANGQWVAKGKKATGSYGVTITATAHNDQCDVFSLRVSNPLTELSLVQGNPAAMESTETMPIYGSSVTCVGDKN